MEYSSASLNQPIGLQKLAALDNIVVYATTTWSGSKYEVTESSGEHLFDVREEPRSFFSWNWALNMALVDVNGVEVISVHRKNRLSVCKLEISIQGSLVSLVHQKRSCLKPLFEILDANEVPAYRLKGPFNQSRSYQFKLSTMDKATIGALSRGWAGLCNELRTNRDYLNISFPQPLDTKYKAACIAVISVHRKNRLGLCKLEISIQGSLISLVHQKWSCLKPLFEILDANEIPAYRLEGPWNRSYQFKLTTMDKATIGGFSRGWAGFRNELRTNGDYLNISFPQPLDTKYKAACIAASIHIIDGRRRRQRSHVHNTSVSSVR